LTVGASSDQSISSGPKECPRRFGASEVAALDLGKAMQEVFGSQRLDILEALQEQPRRYSELAKSLKASEGELSRNLNRLVDAGYLAKGADGTFRPTPLASTVLAHVPSLRF